ncbi:MAG TPA: ATP-dependent RNA helicase DbpA [Betaproteobacteria bacterium]|nr:ATP-dependent RNA helicase DbpA [Betaproteobacteria bacterium]
MSFSSLGLFPDILRAVSDAGYTEPTPIQAQAIPVVLEGRDIMAGAQTGTGKTAAFTLPLLHRLTPYANTSTSPAMHPVRGLILTPTRELAIQVEESVRDYSRYVALRSAAVFGGVNIKPQIQTMQRGVEILVATPGRLLDLMQQKSVTLGKVDILVLDEADRMLDMGFYEDIAEIVAATPGHRQTLLFSATYPEAIKDISASMQNNPGRVSIEAAHTQDKIKQLFFEVADKGKRAAALVTLLGHYHPASCVIFCNTKLQCQAIADTLQEKGFSALALHGDLEQRDRDQVLLRFSNKSCAILVATDVAARGIDIKDLEAVINFELSHDPEVHIHRIGRTGRAGKSGLALSLYIAAESHRVNAIEDYQKNPISLSALDTLKVNQKLDLRPPMVTLCIEGGRKNKVRPGDIPGALTNESGITGDQVGKIDIFDHQAYVAIERSSVDKALQQLTRGKIKGRYFKVRKLQ